MNTIRLALSFLLCFNYSERNKRTLIVFILFYRSIHAFNGIVISVPYYNNVFAVSYQHIRETISTH